MRLPARLASALVVAALVAAAAPPAATGAAARRGIDARLSALAPDRPAEYITLAEDIMDRASGPTADADRALARHLAALAGAIDLQRVGRSAALFLAEHATADADRARMRSIAAVLDPSADALVERAERADAAIALVRAFALYARGDGLKAKEALARSGAAALLDRHQEILRGGSARFRTDCDAMRAGGAPVVAPAQLDALHALAAGSLAGAPRTWSEAVARGGAAPLAEVDLRDPGSVFGVDPALCRWRAGAWVRDEPAARAR